MLFSSIYVFVENNFCFNGVFGIAMVGGHLHRKRAEAKCFEGL